MGFLVSQMMQTSTKCLIILPALLILWITETEKSEKHKNICFLNVCCVMML